MQRILANYPRLLLNTHNKSIHFGFAAQHTAAPTELASGYKPRDVETSQNVVEPVAVQSHLPAYSFILPPPNVTGNLHLGHVLMCTIQDVIARHRRSTGHDVCWVPGTDHAGIATQVVVEKHLRKLHGLGRHDLGRERFLDEVWKWRREKGHRIKEDLIKMSTTMNWDREYFTMDDHQSLAVRQAFIRLFNDGLIYRGDSLVNWSCTMESTISDIEVDNVNISGPTLLSVPGYERPVAFGHITDLAYAIYGKEDEKIVVSTTRPETMLGDVAVAVHPEDTRYVHLRGINTRLWHPIRNEPIPLVFDESVDREFGSGAVKITPAHDRFDFDLAKRHCLPSIAVINEKGFIREEFGEFSGSPRFIARESIKNRLAAMGNLVGTRPHSMQLPICSRSKDVIEHLLKPQWFVRCDEMSKEAIEVVETGDLNIQPDNFRTEWNRWLSESRDWCISRQLWWGHQVPAYECSALGKSIWVAAESEEEARQKAATMHFNNLDDPASISIRQDSDVLDTWFSSALLPFSAFGWPNHNNNNADFERHYPQDILETGHDILFFWVARMVMLGKYLTGKVPFRNVLLHGIVCDAQGRKMSKSLGNVIVPHQVVHGASLKDLQSETKESFEKGILSIDQYQTSIADQAKMFPNGIPECGTDALRFTLLSHNLRTHFINFDANECYTNKLFFNKIWQATRFTTAANRKWSFLESDHQSNGLGIMDRWILSRLALSMQTVDRAMDGMQFHVAVTALKTFLYQNLCDVYLETTKRNLSGNDAKVALNHCGVLNLCLRVALTRMAPLTPSLSQALLQHTKDETVSDSSIMDHLDHNLEDQVQEMLDICLAIRQLKSENLITKKLVPTVILHITDDELLHRLRHHQHDIESLTLCYQVLFTEHALSSYSTSLDRRIVARSTAGPQCSFAIEVQHDSSSNPTAGKTAGDLLNEKKVQKLEADLERLQRTVANEGFQRSASAKVQQQHSDKIQRITSELQTIQRLHSQA